jgi:ABC-2 type transport system permease protein
MLRKPHVQLIAGHSVRHGIRGGAGLMAVIFTMFAGLILASVIVSRLEAAQREVAARGNTPEMVSALKISAVESARKAIDWAVSPSPDQLDYLTNDKPAVVSAIVVLLFLFTPLLACLGGFNQTSGDIASKGLRFLLIRTERPNIFIGRFIGTFLFTALAFLGLFALLAIYMSVKVHVHEPGEMIGWLLLSYLRLVVFALPYVALCSLISCAISSPFGSLAISLLVACMFPVVIAIAAASNDNVQYAQYATPWGFRWWLLEPVGGQLFGGIAIMLGFTAVFLFAGLKYFSARDL